MPAAQIGDTVTVHYVGRLADGTIFSSSEGREPLKFVLGSGQVLPGFERAIEGMTPGERKEVRIPAAEAYGERSEDLVLEIDRADLPEDFEFYVGQQLLLGGPEGGQVRVIVSAITEDTVTFDGNHPLAGKDLYFSIELVSIE